MGVITSYRLRLERRRYLLRAFRKRRELKAERVRAGDIMPGDLLLFCTLRDGRVRLPYFLEYYRKLGIRQFFFVDNGSVDGSGDYLREQPDVSLFSTTHSYKRARYGIDWLNWLQRKYGHGHWCLTVDLDEFLIYPFSDRRPLGALTDWLDASDVRSFGTLMLDTYPRGQISSAKYRAGDDPFAVASWFDGGNYVIEKNRKYWNLWIQGGPRARGFFADDMKKAPALNKIPLVKWHRSYAFVTSTHMLLPRGLNLVFDQRGGEKTSGCLLHAKLLDTFGTDVVNQLHRDEHYGGNREYHAYAQADDIDLWTTCSEQFDGWRQLEMLGLMSKGNWA